jgi:hypothetical protein
MPCLATVELPLEPHCSLSVYLSSTVILHLFLGLWESEFVEKSGGGSECSLSGLLLTYPVAAIICTDLIRWGEIFAVPVKSENFFNYPSRISLGFTDPNANVVYIHHQTIRTLEIQRTTTQCLQSTSTNLMRWGETFAVPAKSKNLFNYPSQISLGITEPNAHIVCIHNQTIGTL